MCSDGDFTGQGTVASGGDSLCSQQNSLSVLLMTMNAVVTHVQCLRG